MTSELNALSSRNRDIFFLHCFLGEKKKKKEKKNYIYIGTHTYREAIYRYTHTYRLYIGRYTQRLYRQCKGCNPKDKKVKFTYTFFFVTTEYHIATLQKQYLAVEMVILYARLI